MDKQNDFAKKKFLFVSNDGSINDLAWQVKKEGHDVLFYIHDKDQKDIGDGFVDKTDDWQTKKDWADVIIFDHITFGSTAEQLRKQGKLVVGGSIYSDKLEMDREFCQEEMKLLNINVLPSWGFTEFDAAIEFINKNPNRYVIKPSGKAQNEKELSFVGQEEDGKDVIQVLEHYKKNWSKKIKMFQLQKYVSGVEIAVGAFFNGKEFVKPILVNFEHKKMFPGDTGPGTGEMGTLAFWADDNIIFNQTAAKFKDKLAQSSYVGYFDINCIVNNKGIYPLEATSRFGYPTISLQIEGVNSKWGDVLYNLAKGENFSLNTKKGFQLCVVIAVPPFPFTDPDAYKKYSEEAIVLFKKQINDGVHLGDVKFIENDWRLAGNSGYALIITESGTTVEEIRKQIYNKISNIMIPNMFYRTDIGLRWYNESDKLQTWGYLH